jgi:hypothetical protein
MARRACTFRQSDVARALRAAASAGVRVRVEIEPSGKITVVPMDDAKLQDSNQNPWDEVLTNDQD